jgi:hypothetical protein
MGPILGAEFTVAAGGDLAAFSDAASRCAGLAPVPATPAAQRQPHRPQTGD